MKFAKAVLNENLETFVVHMTSFILKMKIHLTRKVQIDLFII